MPVSFPRRSGNAQRPEMFEAWAPKFPKANSTLTAAVDELVGSYRQFYQGHMRTMTDETITPGARQVKSAKAARAKLVPLIERLNAAADSAGQAVEALRTKTAAAYNPPNPSYPTVMRHQEIRAHFKAMSMGQKSEALEAAKVAGDEDTLIALVSYQPYLSGLPQQLHQYARDYLIETHAPNEAAALKGIAEQQQMATQFRDTMLQSVADLVDFAKADELMMAASTELA